MSLAYDPLGRLYETTTGTTTTRYLYDGANLVEETDASGVIQRRYAHGQSADEPLVWYQCATPSTCTNDRRFLHSDELGSVIAASDSSGALISGQAYAYDAYGRPANDNWTGSRFRYTGQTLLGDSSATHLYYYKARLYDPALGRFLQTDPIGYADGFNWYAYVGNDPVNGRDPSGLDPNCAVSESRDGHTFTGTCHSDPNECTYINNYCGQGGQGPGQYIPGSQGGAAATPNVFPCTTMPGVVCDSGYNDMWRPLNQCERDLFGGLVAKWLTGEVTLHFVDTLPIPAGPNVAGMTLGGDIYLLHGVYVGGTIAGIRLLGEELYHASQFHRSNPMHGSLAGYAGESLYLYRTGRDPYWDNIYEQEAQGAATRYADSLKNPDGTVKGGGCPPSGGE